MKKQSVKPVKTLRPETLYRLPWGTSDNAMTWLEVTRHCNLNCPYCYQRHLPQSQHKSLAQIEKDLQMLLHLRRCDSIIIAGGEPLTHPDILTITKLVKSYRVKPVLLTNGVLLSLNLLSRLKKAGLFGVTFHIDSHQQRPGWKDKNEYELNELRQQYADMIYNVGNLHCSFDMVVFPDTLPDIPAVVDWAVKNINKVHALMLIAARTFDGTEPWDYYAGNTKININETPYVTQCRYENLTNNDLYEAVLRTLPNYQFNAYLSGTALSNSLKWVIGTHIGSARTSYGNLGARTMKFLQSTYHFFTGTFFSYIHPFFNQMAFLTFLFSLFDRDLREALRKYITSVFRNPFAALQKLYLQSIIIMQPIDVLPNGEQDNCGGCPNMTIWNGKLVPACRMEDYLNYGEAITIVPSEHTKFQNKEYHGHYSTHTHTSCAA